MAWSGVLLCIVGIVASGLFAGLYYIAYQKYQQAMASDSTAEEWEGVIAPDIKVSLLDGSVVSLSELKGKRVILDFWATWCPPCVKEIPHFVRLRNEVSTNDLVLIGISDEDRSTLERFIKKQGINYPIGSAKDAPAPYSDIQSIPTTYFIDRKGVIQKILVGYHDFEELKEHATSVDFEGEPKTSPSTGEEEGSVRASTEPLEPKEAWRVDIAGAKALASGDWDGDGSEEALVLDGRKRLHVLNHEGRTVTTVTLAGDTGTLIELGQHKTAGPRLLTYENWGSAVSVYDTTGKQLWTYAAGSGVDGAHWGDLDGDGSDELVVGMNGGGGLHAVSADGKRLWKVSLGNVWNQAVIPAGKDREARVFATEAGGSVKAYDAKGKLLKSMKPRGDYFAQMSAAAVDAQGRIQIAVRSDDVTLGINSDGDEEWSTASAKDESWRAPTFASGDVDGDGTRDWVFLGKRKELAVITPDGERIATLDASGVDAVAVLTRPNTNGVVVTLVSGAIVAHRFAQAPAESAR
jgi:peroxiredoxin